MQTPSVSDFVAKLREELPDLIITTDDCNETIDCIIVASKDLEEATDGVIEQAVVAAVNTLKGCHNCTGRRERKCKTCSSTGREDKGFTVTGFSDDVKIETLSGKVEFGSDTVDLEEQNLIAFRFTIPCAVTRD